MNKFYAKWGGIETHTPWWRPDPDRIRRWRDDLSFDLTHWYIAGNVVEKHSPTYDVDVLMINPQIPHLSSLSRHFTEMISKGFKWELLIDCGWVNNYYQGEWQPLKKIRPDNGFYKEWSGGIYHTRYDADVEKQIGEQLWYYEFNQPHFNWKKGKERGYKFSVIPLNKF